ncbi:hypothetical protein HK102_006387, partial [Quaeritorhiza haematococci]
YVHGIPTCADVFPGVDIRNDGNGCIYAPPSAFVFDGQKREYTWLPGFSLVDNRDKLMEMPGWLLEKIRKSRAERGKTKKRPANTLLPLSSSLKKAKLELLDEDSDGDSEESDGDKDSDKDSKDSDSKDGHDEEGDDWADLPDTKVPKRCVALSRVRSEVFKLDPNRAYPYDSWRDVSFAIHAATKGSKGGFQIFCEFSAQCPTKYDVRGCHKLWENCMEDAGASQIKFGSLVKWAEDDNSKGCKFDIIYTTPVEPFERLQPILEADFGCCGIASYWDILRGYQFEVVGKRKCFICGDKKKKENMVFEVKQPMPAIFSVRGTSHPCQTLIYGLDVHQHFKDLVNEPTTDVTFSDMIKAMTNGCLRYSKDQWLVFHGHRWHPKHKDFVLQYIQYHCRKVVNALKMCLEAKLFELQKIPSPDKKTAKECDTFVAYVSQLQKAHKYCGSQNHLKTIKENLQTNLHDPELWGTMDDEALLCAENGVIDLKTGELRDGHPDDKISMSLGYEYVTSNPKIKEEVDRFFAEIYPLKAERDLAQKWFGYCLLPTHYQCVMCLLTDVCGGSNGKTTMVDAVRHAMGEYAIRGQNELIYTSNTNRDIHSHQSGLAPYRGKRMVVFEELEPGKTLNTTMLKDYNGASRKLVKYRPAGEKDERKYPWQGKFVFLFNEDRFPSIDTADGAFIERLMVIPHRSKFVAELPDLDPEDREHVHLRNPDVIMKIQGPWRPYVLQWCLQGLQRFYAEEFTKRPASSNQWLSDITMSQDVKELVKAHLVYTGNPQKYIKQGFVWELYRDHCAVNSIPTGKRMKQAPFFKHLRRIMSKGYRDHFKLEGLLVHNSFWGWEEIRKDGEDGEDGE